MSMTGTALLELVNDSERCARLTEWEMGFMESMRSKVQVQGNDMKLSERQLEALSRIEAKMYKV